MRNFDYMQARSLDDAFEFLRHYPSGQLLAGGTDLIVNWKDMRQTPPQVADITAIPQLNVLALDHQGNFHIGAAVPLADIIQHPYVVENLPVLSLAANTVGSNQIRQRATLAGNIANASPSADTVPALLALDAQIVLAAKQGTRTVQVAEFFTGLRQTVKRADELIQEFIIPAPPAHRAIYMKHGRRNAVDLATVGVAAMVACDKAGLVTDARIAIGAVAPVPQRVPQAEAMLLGQKPDLALIEAVARAVRDAAKPISDIRASAAYRLVLTEALTKKALRSLCGLEQ